MKKITLVSVLMFFGLILTSSNVLAQFNFGVKAGYCMPNLSGGNNEVSQDYKTRPTFNIGIIGSYDLNENESIQVELNYASQGGKKDGLQAIINPYQSQQLPNPYIYADFKNEVIFNYLELPILAKYTFMFSENDFNVYVDLGPYIGCLLNAKTKAKGTSNFYADKTGTLFLPIPPHTFNYDTNITNQIHKFNCGLAGGVGFEKSFGNGVLFLDFRGTYGLFNIQKYDVAGKNHTSAATIWLGYALKLD
jgi:hypothetical protein